MSRDLHGYGRHPPNPKWPISPLATATNAKNSKLAISFVLNYEEGGENTIVNGDAASEVFLNEVRTGWTEQATNG